MAAEVAGGGEEQLERWTFKRQRPCHPGRFLAFARGAFGPLLADAAEGRAAPPADGAAGSEASAAGGWREAVREATGRLWFVGSDDLSAEYRYLAAAAAHFAASAASPGRRPPPRQHLCRCGAAWPAEWPEDAGHSDDAGDGRAAAAGGRRTELEFVLGGPGVPAAAVGAARDAVRVGLQACLLTRAEAEELELTGQLQGLEEWEQERLRHEHIAPWATLQQPFLHVVHGLACLVAVVPGVQVAAGVLGGLSRWVERRWSSSGEAPARGRASAGAGVAGGGAEEGPAGEGEGGEGRSLRGEVCTLLEETGRC